MASKQQTLEICVLYQSYHPYRYNILLITRQFIITNFFSNGKLPDWTLVSIYSNAHDNDHHKWDVGRGGVILW